jgi:putative SOS response-associated peptidase YedK
MCGRYTITSTPAQLRELFGYPEQPNFPPRYNVAPTQPIPIVRQQGNARHFALVRWGLIPPWVKDPKGFSLLINARAETAAEKPAFKNAMRRRRCLIPADGFYEWKTTDGRKRPFYARRRTGGPLAFAGLWETWTGPNGEEIETAAIVTTEANRTLSAVHHRMPVVIPPEAFDLWLSNDEVDVAAASRLMAPAPEDLMEVYEVGTAVNKVVNDDARLTAPADPNAEPEPVAPSKRVKPAKEDDGQGMLF